MSELKHTMAMPPAIGGSSMFESAQINSIQGGNYYCNQAGVINQNITNIQSHQRSDVNMEEVIEEVVAMLQRLAIDFIDFGSIHQDIMDKRTRNTGETFKAKHEVQDWRTKRKRVLWVTGGPGTGKTYLSSAFVQWSEVRAEQSQLGDVAVVSLYLRYSETLTAWDIVLSILIQLVQWSDQLPAVAAAVKAALNKRRGPRKNTRPTFDDLVQLLRDIIVLFSEVDIIIDGIDEMLEQIQWPVIEAVTSTEARVLFTSRPIQVVEGRLKDLKGDQLVVVDFVAPPEDLDLFIGGAIEASPNLVALLKEPDAKEEVMTAIKEKAAGMFLHASLQVELLRHCRSLHAVYETIDQFPASIEDLYARTLKRIPEGDTHLAYLILGWLVYARGSLSVSDLQHAIAVSPATHQFEAKRMVSEANITSICRGLVTVEGQTHHIRLVHYTAYESLSKILSDTTPHPHEVIARTCIARLTSCGFQRSALDTVPKLRKAFETNPLLQYAHRNTPYHIREAFKHTNDLKPIIEDFIHHTESFPYLPYDIDQNPEALNMLEPLHLATLFGIDEDVVRLIKECGVGVNLRAGHTSGNGWTSLSIAAREGHTELVELLLAVPGVDVNLITDEDKTPLIIACDHSHNEIVAQLAGVPGINVNALDNDGYSALSCAAVVGNTVAVNAILAIPDVDVNQVDPEYEWAPLLYASWSGNVEVVQILLQVEGIDVNKRGSSAFVIACKEGHEPVVKVLLGIPVVDPKETRSRGLSWAANNGHAAVVKTILGLSIIDVNEANEFGWTPLTLASYKGYVTVVEALLEAQGIDINKANLNGETSLLLAANHGLGPVVDALLKVDGVDSNRQNVDGWSPLSIAAAKGHLGIVQTLLKFPGIDIDQACQFGMTPLMHASRNGSIAVAEALLVRGSDATKISSARYTSLILASGSGHLEIVKLLLGHVDMGHVNLNTEYPYRWSAAILAAQHGYIKILELLLTLPGLDLTWTPSDIGSTILLPILSYHLQYYHSTQIHQADVDPQPIALVLLDRIDVQQRAHVPDSRGWTPLMLASRFGYLAVVEQLLSLPNVNINGKSVEGWTALKIAVDHRQGPIVKMLLLAGGEGIEVAQAPTRTIRQAKSFPCLLNGYNNHDV